MGWGWKSNAEPIESAPVASSLPVPEPSGAHHHHHHHGVSKKMAADVDRAELEAEGSPQGAYFVAPRIEAQPWVLNFYRWLGENTTGIARVDLTRPTPPLPTQYDGNLLFAHKRRQSGAVGAYARGDQDGRAVSPDAGGSFERRAVPSWLPTGGARLKVTRSFQLWRDPEDPLSRPLVDIGAGLAVENGRMRPVARIKIRDLVSIKAAPLGQVKVAHSFQLAKTGLALRVRYECPLQGLSDFWRPPARLMVRLDNCSGTGIHMSPGGVEFDERIVKLGSGLSLRAAASLRFPRQLPIDPDDDDVGIKINRLSLKTLW